MFDVLGSIIASLVSLGFGFLWYSDKLFGKAWRREVGMTDEQTAAKMSQSMAKPALLGWLAELVTALVLSYFIFAFVVESLANHLAVAFWAWLGFSATLQFGSTLWGSDSMKLFFINTFHRLVSFLIIALVLFLV